METVCSLVTVILVQTLQWQGNVIYAFDMVAVGQLLFSESCLIAAFQYLKGTHKKAEEGLFTRACRDRTRGNGFKLKEGRFRLDIRKKSFRMRVVRHWHRLPREAVDAPSLEVFKVRSDGALSNLV